MSNTGNGTEKVGCSYTAIGKVKWYSNLEKTVWQFLKSFSMLFTQNPAKIVFLRKLKTHIRTHTQMYILVQVVLFIVTGCQKQSNSHETVDLLNKLQYNGILINNERNTMWIANWMNLQNIPPSLKKPKPRRSLYESTYTNSENDKIIEIKNRFLFANALERNSVRRKWVWYKR